MENNENIVSFAKSCKTEEEIVKESIEKKEYWKALRLLNSIMQENYDANTLKMAFDLHSKLTGYVGITDDLINMLVSNDVESILLATKGLIDYCSEDRAAAKKYYDFSKNKMQLFVKANGEDFFEHLVGYFDDTKKIHFVEKNDNEYKILSQIEKSLNMGDYRAVEALSGNSFKEASLAHKMAAEAFLIRKKYIEAKEELERVENKNKDVYFDCLLARTMFDLKQIGKEELQKFAKKDVNFAEETIFVSEVLFEVKEPKLVIEFIEKNENKFEFYYPMYFAKGIAYLNIKDNEKALQCFKKVYLLNNRQVAAKEIALLIEKGKKISEKISIHKEFPSEISKVVEKKYNKQMKMSDLDFCKMPILKMEEMMCWLELFGNEHLTSQYLIRLICCQNGIETIKRELLSFQASDWIKKQCIKMLVFSGINDVNIYCTLSHNLKSINIVLPTFLRNETEVGEKGFFSENIDYNKFLGAYAIAFSELAIDNEDFENRIEEVADYFANFLVEMPLGKNSKKHATDMFAAAMLYAACSNNTDVQFESKKVNNSRFATFSTAASQFEISSEELEKFVKQIF